MPIKSLTIDNWLEPDPASQLLVGVDYTAGVSTISREDWTAQFLSYDLPVQVPESIAELFAVARATLLYGWFYYPLYALGAEQMSRVAEAACRHRALELGSDVESFHAAIKVLIEQGVVSGDDIRAWHRIRVLRNQASHPRFQSVIMQPDAVLTVRTALRLVGGLWLDEPLQMESEA